MDSILDAEEHHHLLRKRLKESFTLVYMTALSVIQGVALADLAGNVAEGYKEFTVLHWLLALLTFGILIAIWNEYMMHSTIWDWIPDLRDAALPFTIGALELFLNHTISLSLSLWLVAYALIFIMAVVTTWHMRFRAREEDENMKLLDLLDRRHSLFLLYLIGMVILLLLLALVTWVGGIDTNDSLQTGQGLLALGIILLITACVAGLAIFNVDYWHSVLTYARTGGMTRSSRRRSHESSSV